MLALKRKQLLRYPFKFYISVYLAIVRNKQTRNFRTNAAWNFRFERSPNYKLHAMKYM